MINGICLLLEALSIVICLHHLYGKKFRLDVATIGLLVIDMAMMTVIYQNGLPQMLTLLIYPFIMLYCGVEFGFEIKKLIVNMALFIIIIGLIQFAVTTFICFILRIQWLDNMEILLINVFVFVIVGFVVKEINLEKLAVYFQNKERLLLASLIFSIALVLYCVVNYKDEDKMEPEFYIVLFAGVLLVLGLATNLAKYILKVKQAETELKMYELYEKSFGSLIEDIRLKQHEFDNHINTIYSLHYLYKSYEELVRAQKEYCGVLEKENHYNRLLAKGNSALIGFLYGKFTEIEKRGITLEYHVNVDKLEVGIPVHKIIELVGNLINNAIEALNAEKRRMYILIKEDNHRLVIEVRNEHPYIEPEIMQTYFRKGTSEKGKNRGLGLYNVKKICQDYNLQIVCENKCVDQENWISFLIKTENGLQTQEKHGFRKHSEG